ncbi:MAG: hypothetical protein GX640_16385 [Fibrobacter sp.]|nr:hypothetical protein [Fibrobacter sp.]
MRKLLSRKLRHDLLYWGAVLAVKIVKNIPRRIGITIFGWIGGLIYLFPAKDKENTSAHLRFIYGKHWSEKQIRQISRMVYVNLGKNLFDMIYLSQLPAQDFNKIVFHDSLDGFRNAYNRGKGVIVITAHTGCFEMLLHFFAIHGFRSFAIGRKMPDKRIEELIRQNRSGENIEYMDRTEGPLKVVRFLKEGKAFGVLIDQDTQVESVFADFLGHPSKTPSGPIKMAMKLGIPAFVVTTVRRPDNTHYVFLSEELTMVNTGSFEEDLVSNVIRANDLICKTIDQYPSQWVWMHRRWHHQPVDNSIGSIS